MRLTTLKVPAGQAIEFAAAGDYVRVRSSAVTLTIEQPDAGENIEVSQGDDFQFTPFHRLIVSHGDAAEQTVKLIVSKGKKAGSAQVGGTVTLAGAVSVGNFPANNGAATQGRASVTAAAAITLLNANANRRALLIQNNDTGAVLRFTLDGNAPTATAGFRLQPGDSFDVPGYCLTGAVKAIYETATALASNVEYCEA